MKMKPWGPLSQRVSDATIMPYWADPPSGSIWNIVIVLCMRLTTCVGRKLKVENGVAGDGWVLLEGCQVTGLPLGVGVYSCPFSGLFIFHVSEHIMFWGKWIPNSMILYRLKQTIKTRWWVGLSFSLKNCPTRLLIGNDVITLKDTLVQLIAVNLVNVWNIPRCQMQDMGKVLNSLVCGWRGRAQKEDGVEVISKLSTHLILTMVLLDT